MSVMAAAASKLARWRESPISFVTEEMGYKDLDDFQVEFFRALGSERKEDKRIALKASKGPGKTFCLAGAGWWFLATQGDKDDHPNAFAISITGDNLKANLWKELSRWHNRSEFLKAAFEVNKTEIFAKDHPLTWWLKARAFAKGGTTQEQSDSIAGLHSGYVLTLIDESGGIPPAIGVTAEASLSGPIWGKIAQAGNTTSLDGLLYDSTVKHRKMWKVITINGDPDNENRAKRVDIEWARQQISEYGRDNPWVMVNVLGEFPPSSLNTLLGVEDVERALTRFGAVKENDYNYAQKRIGCDVHRFGDDSDVFFPRQGIVALTPVVMRQQRGPVMAARIAMMKKRWGGNIEIYVDDTGGYGATLEDALHTIHIPYIPVDFGGRALDPKFENRRAEMYWNMAEWIKDRGALPETCSAMVTELSAVQYTFTNKNRLILEPKADLKARLGFSPDHSDGLALTFANPEAADMTNEFGKRIAAHAGVGEMISDWDPLEDGR